MRRGSYQATERMYVETQVPRLSALHLTGHGNTTANRVDAVYFRVHHSGMGDLDLEVHGSAQSIDLDLSGHGQVTVRGLEGDGLDLRHSGMGDVSFR